MMEVGELLNTIREQASNIFDFQTSAPVLGTIKGGALELDDFETFIPKGDYTIYNPTFELSTDKSSYTTYYSKLILNDGDRVLCIPINGGRRYVVLGQVN